MKKKFLVVMIVTFCFYAQAQASFSISDVTGTWYGHALISGNAGWETSTLVADTNGNVVITWLGADGNTGIDQATVDISWDGILTVDGNSEAKGSMSPDKDFFVMTDTWNENEYALMIFTKKGNQFSISDLAGTWYGHALVSGNAGWETSTLEVDTAGNVSVAWQDSAGDSGTDNASISILPDGKISVPGGSDVHGVMNLNKDFFVMVETWDENVYALMVYTRKGTRFSTADLEGKWSGHGLISGNAGWETLTLESDVSGNIIVNWKESDGDTGVDHDTIGLSSDGLLTVENGPDVHGAMGINKNLMVITDSWDQNEYALTLLVKGLPLPKAEFIADKLSGVSSLTVQFTDMSQGDITSRFWEFGDNSTSSIIHPSHTYSSPGVYSVTLTIEGPGGSDKIIRTGYIRIGLSDLDNNDDTQIDLMDVSRVLQVLAGKTPEPDFYRVKDVGGDNKTGMEEGILTLQWLGE